MTDPLQILREENAKLEVRLEAAESICEFARETHLNAWRLAVAQGSEDRFNNSERKKKMEHLLEVWQKLVKKALATLKAAEAGE